MTSGLRLRFGYVRAVLALASGPMLAACSTTTGSVLDPHGMVAAAQRSWIITISLLMMVVVVPIFVMVPLFAWRYRRRGGGVYKPDWTFFLPLEYLVWGVPMVIVVLMATLIITRETPLDPYAPLPGGAPLEVDVVALDWKFLFIYPEQHVATVSLLAIPQGRPVAFRLTSDATMQSFFIPGLGSQIYAMAGMVTQLHLRADRPGTLEGENTQFNGDEFQNDRFSVEVLSADGFNRFVADCRAGGRTLDAGTYATVAERTNTVQAKARFALSPNARMDFGDVQPDLFRAIVARYHPGEDATQMTMPSAVGTP